MFQIKSTANVIIQITTDSSINKNYIRYKWGIWGDWRLNYDSGLLSNTTELASLASALGGIITHFELIISGELFEDTNPHNYPTRYGTCIKFVAYYSIYLLTDNSAEHLWISSSGDFWTQVK